MKKQNTFLWNAVFYFIILVICAGVYASAKKVDYIWRWERLPQYIFYTGTDEYRAPGDGIVVVEGKSVFVQLDESGEKVLIVKGATPELPNGDMVFEGDVVAKSSKWKIGPLLEGLYVTLEISFVSIIFAIIIGIVAGMMRISSNPALKKLSVLYVELVRGTPLLVQIFIFYYFIGTVMSLERFTAGVAALAVFAGAYVAEIVRAGIQSIHKGQTEAARSLGMNYYQTMRYVILPQALKRTLPPMAGQFISLIKDSSLVSVISITDLTKAGREVVTSTFSPFEVWFCVAFLYLILTSGLSYLVMRIERKLAQAD